MRNIDLKINDMNLKGGLFWGGSTGRGIVKVTGGEYD
jgi:hypothetical protein